MPDERTRSPRAARLLAALTAPLVALLVAPLLATGGCEHHHNVEPGHDHNVVYDREGGTVVPEVPRGYDSDDHGGTVVPEGRRGY